MYIPLAASRRLLGDVVILRSGGVRSAEAVPLSQVLVTVREPGQVRAAVASIRARLELYHPRPDWEIAGHPDRRDPGR